MNNNAFHDGDFLKIVKTVDPKKYPLGLRLRFNAYFPGMCGAPDVINATSEDGTTYWLDQDQVESCG